MKVLVIGCGLVGTTLARSLRERGHSVVGTTTTSEKVARLEECCDEVHVLRGSDQDRVHAAAADCDAIVVCAGPSAQSAMTPEQRRATYHDVLVETARSAASVPQQPRVIALSSLSVYGDAADHLDLIDEDAPLTDADDPSPVCFQAAERAYLAHAPGRCVVFRCADITGGDDPPITAKVEMAHQYLGGSVPFHDNARFYRVHVDDVVAAILHALDRRLCGVFNLTHEGTPPRNGEFFDAVCASRGLPKLQFRNELKAPGQPVSVGRLYATGFQLEHTSVESLPTAFQST